MLSSKGPGKYAALSLPEATSAPVAQLSLGTSLGQPRLSTARPCNYFPPLEGIAAKALADCHRAAGLHTLSFQAAPDCNSWLLCWKCPSPHHYNACPLALLQNLERGRGLLCRTLMKSQLASTEFSATFAALVAIINTKLPEVGELLLKRVVWQVGLEAAAPR